MYVLMCARVHNYIMVQAHACVHTRACVCAHSWCGRESTRWHLHTPSHPESLQVFCGTRSALTLTSDICSGQFHVPCPHGSCA